MSVVSLNGAPIQAARTAEASDYDDLPQAMLQARRWLLYDPDKQPYYVNGAARSGKLDTPGDVARFGSFEEAIAALQRDKGRRFVGPGFALGPDGTGNYWQMIDFDHVEDHPEVQFLIGEGVPGYLERSPSGKGIHAIGYGRLSPVLGSKGDGIEFYAEKRYATVTGQSEGLGELTCLADYAEQRLAPLRAPRPQQDTGATKAAPRRASQAERFARTFEAGGWHDATRDFTARLVRDGMQPESILALAPAFQRPGFSLAQTEDEIRVMVAGASKFGPKPSPNIPDPTWSSFADLQHKVFPPLAWVIPEYLPQGVTLVAGRPKLGKSWLVLDWAVAVARGGFSLDQKVQEGDVLYAALEDNERRLKSRGQKLVSGPWPPRLSYIHNMPRADEGGVAMVRAWLEAADNPRLVVIDTLARVRPGKGRDEGSYEADYAAVVAWKALADEFEVAIVLVHHVRKAHAEDPLEMVSGTNGLTGAADTILVLNRDGQGVTLGGRGRDIEEFERAVRFDRDTCRWSVLGEASDVRRSDERQEVLAELLEEDNLTPTDLATRLGKQLGAMKMLLHRMAKAGEVVRGERRGAWRRPDRLTPCYPSDPVTHDGESDDE